ncbi:MAG: hypothetical protein QOJ71_853 [Actinomycetota bacterium]|nr:hypothetical protein [Actinomycetota bacterium]
MDETPDQILARLERHAESVRQAKSGKVSPNGAAPLPGAHSFGRPVGQSVVAPGPAPLAWPGVPDSARATAPVPVARVGPNPTAAPRRPIPAHSSGPSTAMPSRALLRDVAAPGRIPVSTPEAPPGPRFVVWGDDRDSDLIPIEFVEQPRFGLVVRTIAGQAVAVLACLVILVVSVAASATVTSVVAGVVLLAALFASFRRLPLAAWWTFGWLLGWVLGRFS